MTLVGAIDPGLATGFAVYDSNTGWFASWEQEGMPDFTQLAGCAVLLCEKFDVNAKTAKLTRQDEAQLYTGMAQQFCLLQGIEFHYSPRSAKKFSKDDKLKALYWYMRTKDGHANDAARHLLVYLLKKNLLTAEDRLNLKGVLE